MKRLNENTKLPFKYGDTRKDGYRFSGYDKSKLKKDGTFYERWLSELSFNNQLKKDLLDREKRQSSIEGRVRSVCWSLKHKAKKQNIPFDLTTEYLLSILPEVCPVFNKPFAWFEKAGKIVPMSPSIDKIVPSKGYIKGNVQWLSNQANCMKSNASLEQLKQFAEWILNQS